MNKWCSICYKNRCALDQEACKKCMTNIKFGQIEERTKVYKDRDLRV